MDTRYIVNFNPNTTKKLQPKSKAFIREYSCWSDEKRKQYTRENRIFNAFPCKYAQPVYYKGWFIKNPPRLSGKSLVRYDFQEGEPIYDSAGYCQDMIVMPRNSMCGLHGGVTFPTIVKIIPIEDTVAFSQFMCKFLSQRIDILTNSQKSNYRYQYKQIPENVKSTPNQPMPSPNCSPSPDPQGNDDFGAANNGNHRNNQSEDSDGDQFMRNCEAEDEINKSQSEAQKNTNNDNNTNNNNNNNGSCLSQTQTKHFLNKKFIRNTIHNKNLKGAIRKCKQAKVKARNKTKQGSRQQIHFTTKYNYCLMVEGGMGKHEAWKWCNKNGFNVGKSSSGCGRWAKKGSNYYMRLIAKYGDAYKFRRKNFE